ncbi:MAG: hypothetical protein CFE26_09995 [Verrucomicrobiales bacterium VVV1]|nr:MAG: hypothetical protein CFE26_09995 [Verrucomicrobiales bacterium VVV1]
MLLKPILALSILALASCATIAPPAPKGTVDHVVVLWLKRPGNALAYETNPVHVKKVETVLKPLAGKILVYDVTR